jgi:uncharacterized protein (DUF58 family)
LVREHDAEERSIIWLVVDASAELWSGAPGTAPLDVAINEAATIASQHVHAGDAVGLVVLGSRVLGRLAPESGPTALARIFLSLALDTQTHDADRSGLDQAAVAARVLEHLRPLEPELARGVSSRDFDGLARHASVLTETAPFALSPPDAPSDPERALRHYLKAFGVASPPKLDPERARTDAMLCEILLELAQSRPHPGLIYVFSPAPDAASRGQIEAALRRLPKQRVGLSWIPSEYEPGLDALQSTAGGNPALLRAITDAIKLRMQVLTQGGETSLRRLGVRVERPYSRRKIATRRALGDDEQKLP